MQARCCKHQRRRKRTTENLKATSNPKLTRSPQGGPNPAAGDHNNSTPCKDSTETAHCAYDIGDANIDAGTEENDPLRGEIR